MHITIIGGGIAGLVGALTSLRAGHQITLYEAQTIGSGASGKALGLLVPVTGLNRPIDTLQRQGIALWPEICQHLSEVTNTPLQDFYRPHPNNNHQLRLPHIFHLLKQAILHHGGTIHENTPAPVIRQSGNPVTRTIFAAGYTNKTLTAQPLTLSAGLACRMQGSLPGLIAQNNLFLAPDWDGTILAGSLNWHLKEMPANPNHIPEDKLTDLLQRIHAIAPGLQLLEAWVGYRPVQTPRTPLLTQISPNTYTVTGLGKIGLGLAPTLNFHAI